MKQQLYIGGIAVDMPADEIKIKVASNLFTDVSKIATAHSYNIALPRTMTNDALFALAYIPTAATGGVTTHRYLTASLHIDGVPIFDGGKAIVTAVDEKGYNINLFWGLAGVLDEIKEEGLKLCDLPMSRRWNEAAMETWIALPQYNALLPSDPKARLLSGMDYAVYNTLDDESKELADVKPWHTILVTANDILNKIAQVYGIAFEFSPKSSVRIGKIYHPLTSLNIKCKDEIVRGTLVAGNMDGILGWETATDLSQEFEFEDLLSNTNGLQVWYHTRHDANVTFDSIHVHGTAYTEFWLNFNATWANGCKHPEMYEYIADDWRIPATDNGDGSYSIDAWFYNVTTSGSIPQINHVGWADPTPPSLYCDIVMSGGGDMQVRDAFSPVRNYPDLKVTDYLTELLVHCGAFVVGSLTEVNTIKIVTYDEVLAADGVKMDSQAVQEITMSIDDVAQHNRYKHSDNDDDLLNYDASGEILCNDETLKFERDAFSSHFKVPRNNLCKLWDVKANENNEDMSATWAASGDYICAQTLTEYVDNSYVAFDGVIENYYSQYRNIIYHPKVVEVSLRLSVVDLLKFDMEKPIYINQLGAKYAVMSLESDNGENYKAKLIQL